MPDQAMLEKIRSCFDAKFIEYGASPEGVYWNSPEAQELRFEQLLKVCPTEDCFSLLDYGCGYGALAGYITSLGCSFTYLGYDLVPNMICQAQELYANRPDYQFTSDDRQLTPMDYVVASGIFNMKLNIPNADWTDHVLKTLDTIDHWSLRGFSFNLLTSYSDPERMRPELYYADPCFFFDYCKKKYSRNIALLHDYGLYDFTILVRKEN